MVQIKIVFLRCLGDTGETLRKHLKWCDFVMMVDLRVFCFNALIDHFQLHT